MLPSARTVLRPRYLWLLAEAARFYRAAHRLLEGEDDGTTVREFLAGHRFSNYFAAHFVTPVIAAVWSMAPTEAGDYPARYLLTFLENHGARMLTSIGAFLRALGLVRPGAPDTPGKRVPTRTRWDSPPSSRPAPVFGDPVQAALFEACTVEARHVDEIALRARVCAPLATTGLLTLALENVLLEGPEGFYRRAD